MGADDDVVIIGSGGGWSRSSLWHSWMDEVFLVSFTGVGIVIKGA